MKKIILLVLVLFLFTGCAECISVEQQEVDVKIVEAYHRPSYCVPMRVGKVTTIMTYPAIYRITIEYNDKKYTINGSQAYHKYKDKVNQTVKGILEIRTYDDDTVKYNIISIE